MSTSSNCVAASPLLPQLGNTSRRATLDRRGLKTSKGRQQKQLVMQQTLETIRSLETEAKTAAESKRVVQMRRRGRGRGRGRSAAGPASTLTKSIVMNVGSTRTTTSCTTAGPRLAASLSSTRSTAVVAKPVEDTPRLTSAYQVAIRDVLLNWIVDPVYVSPLAR
jgi:hypothetical protein